MQSFTPPPFCGVQRSPGGALSQVIAFSSGAPTPPNGSLAFGGFYCEAPWWCHGLRGISDFVQRAIKDAGVKLILRDRQQMELPGAPPSMIIDFKDALASIHPGAHAELNPGDAATRSTIAEILYTSGTTAEPRGVVLTHGNFLANLEPLERGIDGIADTSAGFTR